MKLFKKIGAAVLAVIILLFLGGYLYFQNKFSPPENYLNVCGAAENIPMKWISSEENSHSALLLPVKINGIDQTFYMQFDTGSPVTVFYRNSLKSIKEKFHNPIRVNDRNQVQAAFRIGDLKVISNTFKVLDYGSKIDFENPEAVHIIGTIGTDLLEKRIMVLDFKNNLCNFAETFKESDFSDFEFKKRKILISADVENENLKLLYDSGTSGYELITTKENWQNYRIKNSPVEKEKGNSWGTTLSIYSTSARKKIQFNNKTLHLSEVTYIEGISELQKFLMKRSGMQGMIGNKLFLNHKLILDCKNEKFKIE
ncbi:hypothetical protein ASE21_15075 [Flavobacterium sp. Root901]|uniref:hypothetical protein n=1 Tax=Flavobacterium sp. Root901 TaxID=1736605 RepID=UPI00070ED448|nr:hypothetical protein [Flavobacterium sp. Root901]KRD09196.1 hypothetical protein ASE21_15075 [Flavobacterium sp. Root901]